MRGEENPEPWFQLLERKEYLTPLIFISFDIYIIKEAGLILYSKLVLSEVRK